jgi:hypothetical protein
MVTAIQWALGDERMAKPIADAQPVDEPADAQPVDADPDDAQADDGGLP